MEAVQEELEIEGEDLEIARPLRMMLYHFSMQATVAVEAAVGAKGPPNGFDRLPKSDVLVEAILVARLSRLWRNTPKLVFSL
jgi:hypothetical protein